MEVTEAEIAELPPVVRRQYEAMQKSLTPAADEPQQTDQPEADSDPDPVAENPAPAAPVSHDQDWKHRFSVLQGKYNAEVPRLHEELRALRDENARIRADMDAMRRPEPAAPEPSDPLTRAEEYGFDEESAQWIKKMARQAVQDDIASVKQTAKAMEQQRAQAETERFYAALEAAVPGWRATWFEDAGFAQWIDEQGARGPLQAVLNANDVQGIAFYLRLYRKEQAPQAATPAKLAAAEALAAKVEPERGRASETPAAQPMLRRDDLRKLSLEFAKGRITEAEFNKRVAPFEAAEREGRLT